MTEQLEIFVARQRTATAAEVARLESALRGRGWATAEELGAALGWGDRKVRAVASEATGIISMPGRAGYCLLGECTVEDFARYEGATESQIRKMQERLARNRRAFHARKIFNTESTESTEGAA